jgi:thiamine biosynthesis lipoprotein ApbE
MAPAGIAILLSPAMAAALALVDKFASLSSDRFDPTLGGKWGDFSLSKAGVDKVYLTKKSEAQLNLQGSHL